MAFAQAHTKRRRWRMRRRRRCRRRKEVRVEDGCEVVGIGLRWREVCRTQVGSR